MVRRISPVLQFTVFYQRSSTGQRSILLLLHDLSAIRLGNVVDEGLGCIARRVNQELRSSVLALPVYTRKIYLFSKETICIYIREDELDTDIEIQ
jgi:hypothetical protein